MTIHAFTELHNNFPAFINLSEQPDGSVKVSVRTRGNDGKEYASICLTALQAEELADSIYKHNYKGEYEIDRPAASSSAAPSYTSLLAQAIDACDSCMDVMHVEPEDAAAWQVVRAALAAPAASPAVLTDADIKHIVESIHWSFVDYSYDAQIEFARAIERHITGQAGGEGA